MLIIGNQEYIQLDTANILFICGGAFVDLDQIIEQRISSKTLGFSSETPKETAELLAEVRPEDLVKYGLIPEFIGRLPVLSLLEELSRAELVKVLRDTKNSLLKQYQKLFLMEGAELADSVAWDMHKLTGIPLVCSAFLIKELDNQD